jgi:hypothetical protein
MEEEIKTEEQLVEEEVPETLGISVGEDIQSDDIFGQT